MSFFRSFRSTLFYGPEYLWGIFRLRRGRKEKRRRNRASLSHTRFMRNRKVAKKAPPSSSSPLFYSCYFFRSGKEGNAVSDAIYTLALASKRGVSLFLNLDRGRGKSRQAKEDRASVFLHPPKNIFFKKKYPPPCVSHIRTTKGRIIGLN